MNKEFIPYEQALQLKEFGFDEECLGYYFTLDNKIWHFAAELEMSYTKDYTNIGNSFILSTPLYQQAFRWFRDKYVLFSGVLSEYSYGGEIHAYHITGKRQGNISSGDFTTYEEAELACLKKLIEIVKGGKQ